MSECGLNADDLDEKVVAQFLDEQLPHCRCPAPVGHTREDLRAALGHLLVVLRANAVIPERVLETTPVDEELRRFDAHMDRVRGLAATTRRLRRRIVRGFLLQQFGDGRVDFSAIKPEAVRRFITDQNTHYSSPGGIVAVISALRCYFRFRTACGDQVQALIAVLIAPRHWRQASLPKALSTHEVQRLVDSLGWEGPSARRSDAMVRLALDLGLRRGEIAWLALEDIDWRAGTIRLRRTKGGREDILPLPETTGLPSPITSASTARQQPAARCSCVASLLVAVISAPTASARQSARPMPAPDCPTPGPTCCATPWPAVCWRAAAR